MAPVEIEAAEIAKADRQPLPVVMLLLACDRLNEELLGGVKTVPTAVPHAKGVEHATRAEMVLPNESQGLAKVLQSTVGIAIVVGIGPAQVRDSCTQRWVVG